MRISEIFIFLINSLLISHITVTCKISYEDSIETIKKRLNFGRNYTQIVTDSKINFEYSEKEGVFCRANADLYPNQFVFKIPSKFILCSFDIFPFKFEFAEPIKQLMISKYGANKNSTRVRTTMYMMTYHLMFLYYPNKHLIIDYLKKNDMEYYVPEITPELSDYLDSLQKLLYTANTYSRDERKLSGLVGFRSESENIDQIEELYAKMLSFVSYNKNWSQELKELILPWISNLELLRYCNGLLTSRAYKTNIVEYQLITGIKMEDRPEGVRHKKLIFDIDPDTTGQCLVPFIDLCNHKNPTDVYGNNVTNWMIIFRKGAVYMGANKAFKSGELFEYSYVPLDSSSNNKLVTSYGFYVENNPLSTAVAHFHVTKALFGKVKHELCIKLNCFDYRFDSFYNDSKVDSANIQVFLNPHEINERILNAIRLYVLPNHKFPLHKVNTENYIHDRLLNKKWINYQNEIMGFTYYRSCIVFQLGLYKLKQVLDIILIYYY